MTKPTKKKPKPVKKPTKEELQKMLDAISWGYQ
jgi:hypothetical protein